MGKRTNTATWSDKYKRWQINVQKDAASTAPRPAGTGSAKRTQRRMRGWMTESLRPASG